ncbi:MFS transporter [Arvimicrobium flavum]|uniref:MFS transporter n=1 Tax=Arvimicrobium flavum TaxID=3393320 RepID=UPI00237C4445|nr:MFS transporter [Mesorhizobium shangrilense]
MNIGLTMSPANRIYAGFGIYSFGLGNIFPRLPDIQASMGIEEGALGLGLIGTPVGTLAALTFAAPILERIGYRAALLTTIPLMSLGYALAVHAPGPLIFFLLLIPVGLMVGTIEVALNVEADRTEHLIGRRIMNRAHSFWSFGFFGAGLFGSGLAQLGLSPQVHLALVVPICLLGAALIFGNYEPAPHRAESKGETLPLVARPSAAILILVVVTLGAMLMEGASMDWSAIYMRDVYSAGPFWSGFAVALFALTQATSRFFADRFVDRYSPSRVARFLLSVLTAGILLVFFSHTPALSLLGFALLGIGSSAIFPLAISAAAQRTDRPSAINVAALAQISFVIFLLGPPLLGFVAEHWGIRWAFGLGLPLVLVAFAMAGALGRKQAYSRDRPDRT